MLHEITTQAHIIVSSGYSKTHGYNYGNEQ